MRSSPRSCGELPANLPFQAGHEKHIPCCARDDQELPHVGSLLREVKGALEGALFGFDLLLELQNGVENGFWTRRAAGNVDIDGDDLIAALNDGIVIEHAAGGGASAHGDNPLGLGHLIVELANDRSHFLGEATGDDHEIGLAGRGAKHFSAKTGQVEPRGGHGHHFDGATGKAKTEGPDGTFASPVHSLVELGEDDTFVLKELTEIVGFGERNALPQRRFHMALVTSFSFWHRWGGVTNRRAGESRGNAAGSIRIRRPSKLLLLVNFGDNPDGA